MSYGPNIRRSIDIHFFQFPLGINLKERWINQNESEIYVHKILLHNESTKYIKPGYVLKRINEKRLENDSLQDVQIFLANQKSITGKTTPLICTFGIFDVEGSGTPLFDPFNNKNDTNCNTCDVQKTQFYEHTNMKIPMTSLPGSGTGSGASSDTTCSAISIHEGGTANATVLHGGGGGVVGENKWLNANDIINVNDLKKHMINIDSDFRTNILNPTSDFVVVINPVIPNVIRIRLASAEIPNTYYEFSDAKRNTFIRLISPTAKTDYTFQILEGNYDSASMESAIQNAFAGKVPAYRISINPISGKTTISTSDNSAFIMDFRTQYNSNDINPDLLSEPLNNWGLAYNLGFRHKYYSNNTDNYESESMINTLGDQYIFLKINDYYTVIQPLKDGNTLEAFTKIILRGDKYTEIFNDSSDLLTRDYVFPQPRDISRIHVKLVDKYDQPIDLIDMAISISLEITEVMNCKLYDFYRNYLFKKKSVY